MSTYSMFQLGNGVRYTLDKKIIAKAAVPVNILELLEIGKDVSDENVDTNEKYKGCIFCQAHSPFQRLLNGKIVYLCDEHYYSKTIGELAQQLRELQGAQHVQSN